MTALAAAACDALTWPDVAMAGVLSLSVVLAVAVVLWKIR